MYARNFLHTLTKAACIFGEQESLVTSLKEEDAIIEDSSCFTLPLSLVLATIITSVALTLCLAPSCTLATYNISNPLVILT
jgi:hypothetical protein